MGCSPPPAVQSAARKGLTNDGLGPGCRAIPPTSPMLSPMPSSCSHRSRCSLACCRSSRPSSAVAKTISNREPSFGLCFFTLIVRPASRIVLSTASALPLPSSIRLSSAVKRDSSPSFHVDARTQSTTQNSYFCRRCPFLVSSRRLMFAGCSRAGAIVPRRHRHPGCCSLCARTLAGTQFGVKTT
jgi:hypothetical protein